MTYRVNSEALLTEVQSSVQNLRRFIRPRGSCSDRCATTYPAYLTGQVRASCIFRYSTGHLIYTVSSVRALRACLDPNGSAYQVDLPMTSEPFPRRIGLFESLSIPVDRLLITICIYTSARRLPAIHFLLRQGSLPEGTY